LSDHHVLLGLTSKILPSRGTPGGCGIGVDMAAGVWDRKSWVGVEVEEERKSG
jgi:hypothetical protein